MAAVAGTRPPRRPARRPDRDERTVAVRTAPDLRTAPICRRSKVGKRGGLKADEFRHVPGLVTPVAPVPHGRRAGSAVDRLEDAGPVRRQPHPIDRRAILVTRLNRGGVPRRRGRTSTTRPGGRRCPSSPGRAARGWPAPSTRTIHAEAVPNSCTNTPRPALARPQPHGRDYPEVTILCASCLAASPWPPAATAWLTNAGVSTTVTRWWWSAQRRLVGLKLIPNGTGQISGGDLVEMPG